MIHFFQKHVKLQDDKTHGTDWLWMVHDILEHCIQYSILCRSIDWKGKGRVGICMFCICPLDKKFHLRNLAVQETQTSMLYTCLSIESMYCISY